MEPVAVHHVSINVTNAKDSVAFYTEILGGRRRDDRPDFGIGGAWLDFGPSQVHLIESSVPPNLGQHFALQVDDLDAVVSELRSKGIVVDAPVSVGSDRQTFIEDPSGNVVELHEVASGPA